MIVGSISIGSDGDFLENISEILMHSKLISREAVCSTSRSDRTSGKLMALRFISGTPLEDHMYFR